MARFNEILVGRYNRFLQKLLSMKGGPVAAQLASEVTPAIPLYYGVENRALESWYRFGLLISAAAGVGPAQARLRNPPGSNRLVVFEKIAISDDTVAAASGWNLETQTIAADLGSIVVIAPNVSWDKRLNVASGLIASTNVAAASALSLVRQFAFLTLGANYDFIIEEQQEVILSPGEAIQIRSSGNAKDLNTTWWWRERGMEDSEVNA